MTTYKRKHEWLFAVLVDPGNVVLARDQLQIGSFELTSRPEPFLGVEDSLAQSVGSYNYGPSQRYMRMRILLTDCTLAEARREGFLYAREALTLFRHAHVFVEKLRLLEAGYLVNLETLESHPFLIPDKYSVIGTFVIQDERMVDPLHALNRLMRLDPSSSIELGAAIRRSAHWADLAGRTEDLGEQLLMKWLAVECLCRVKPEESINAKVAAAALFPSRRYEQHLPSSERTALLQLSRFNLWRGKINELIDKLRDLRNKIVHSGFRELDLRAALNSSDIYIARKLLTFACSGAQRLALNALDLDIMTIDEMWQRYAECIMARREMPLAQEVSHGLIFALENPAQFEAE